MKWEDNLKYKLALLNVHDSEEIYKICLAAYAEGCVEIKKKALEAYRLRCSNLCGNRCIDSFDSVNGCMKVCNGDCYYIKKYEFELFKLED